MGSRVLTEPERAELRRRIDVAKRARMRPIRRGQNDSSLTARCLLLSETPEEALWLAIEATRHRLRETGRLQWLITRERGRSTASSVRRRTRVSYKDIFGEERQGGHSRPGGEERELAAAG